MKRVLRFLARAAGWPLRLPFNAWFRRLSEQIHASQHDLQQQVASLADDLSKQVGELQSHVSSEARQSEIIAREVQETVRVDSETVAELSLAIERTVARTDHRLEILTERLGDDAMQRLVGQSIDHLTEAGAHLVNWANGAIGMAGETGMWINTGVNLLFSQGRLRIESVNERIVELPFAHEVAAGIPRGGRVLDVGATESLLALELASLGYRVTAVDPRPYPFQHPNLTVVAHNVEEWEGPNHDFDAIFCISTIEHIGLGHYVPSTDRDDLDRFVMKLLATWLAPSGVVVLTVPFGQWSVDDFQRVYDRAHLERLLAGWIVEDRRVFVPSDSRTWAPMSDEAFESNWSHESVGVALIRLRQPT